MSSNVIFPAQPEQILKGLSKVWTSLGQEEKQQGKPTVLRACAMTLIIATDESDAGFQAAQTISELMREHPSRGIVLAVSKEAEHGLEARVLAQCWKPFGKAQQICCEQIEITARPEEWPNVGPTLIGLTVADLPVVFWCQHQGALCESASKDERGGFDAVANIATKVIVDTAELNRADAFALLSRLRSRGKIVADLEWARLTPWRQPFAQIFDNPARERHFDAFHTIEIEHLGDEPSLAALYAAAWLTAPYGAKARFVGAGQPGRGIVRITLLANDERIDFERTSPESALLRSSIGRERAYSFGELTGYTLLHEELSITGPDPVFDSAFRRAKELFHDRH